MAGGITSTFVSTRHAIEACSCDMNSRTTSRRARELTPRTFHTSKFVPNMTDTVRDTGAISSILGGTNAARSPLFPAREQDLHGLPSIVVQRYLEGHLELVK